MKISFLNKYIQPISPEPVKEQARQVDLPTGKGANQKSKVDSTEISGGRSSSLVDKKLQLAKSSVLYEVSVSSSPKRITELKAAVDNGTYKIPAGDLADAILK